MTGATISQPLASGRSRSRATQPWSHRAWAQTLGVEVPLLSDWNGEAIRAFDVSFEPLGMHDVAVRTAFLIRDGETIEAAWLLGGELPDIDAVIAAARALSASDA